MKFLSFILVFITSNSFANQIQKADFFNISKYIPEVSGAVYNHYQNTIWSIGDSGKRVLGVTDLANKSTKKIPITGYKIATDREELIQDQNENIWILSVGDNDRVRSDIEINMINPYSSLRDGRAKILRNIKISYPHGAIDVEAAYYFEDKIYLIEKTFSSKARIYSVDISEGAPKIQITKYENYIDSSKTRLMTAACMDEKENLYVLTYYGTFQLKNWKSSTPIKTKTINFSPFINQMETLVCYKDQLLIANENGAFWLEDK